MDCTTPNAARIYDYDLGGEHNFAADRAASEEIQRTVAPTGPFIARANRAFLQRAVRFCLDRGIDQFLDLGSGIPTLGNVHEIAQSRDPRARVLYVDVEPVAVAHTRHLLGETTPQASSRPTSAIPTRCWQRRKPSACCTSPAW